MRNLSFLLLMTLFFVACSPAAPKKQSSPLSYFDLKGFIANEVNRLKAVNPVIDKTVMVNHNAEHKKLKIADWQKELSAFADADINKSAWQGLFTLKKDKEVETYKSDNEKVPVKSIRITYKHGKPAGIEVLISNANILYTSNDTLSYYPDSIYQVKKTQRIKLLNQKNYKIIGLFTKLP